MTGIPSPNTVDVPTNQLIWNVKWWAICSFNRSVTRHVVEPYYDNSLNVSQTPATVLVIITQQVLHLFFLGLSLSCHWTGPSL